jgi:3-oxoacyl-[acyl-carrier-protein] synthase-3
VLPALIFIFTTTAAALSKAAGTKVVVVGADKMSAIVDYTDALPVYFLRWSGAVLLEPSEEGGI